MLAVFLMDITPRLLTSIAPGASYAGMKTGMEIGGAVIPQSMPLSKVYAKTF
jgi:hypothetical protein